MLMSVTNRFIGSPTPASTHQHHQVHSSVPQSVENPAFFEANMKKLGDTSTNSASEKNRRISNQTRQMLIKSKAKGNDNCVPENRMYFVVHFESDVAGKAGDMVQSETVKYLFVSKHATLGEFLFNLKSQFADLILYLHGKSFRSLDDIGLGVQTRDTQDWGLWNRNLPLESVFSDLEEVWIVCVPMDEVILRQKEEERRHAERVVKSRVFAKLAPVWYYRGAVSLLVDEAEARGAGVELIAAKILAVHHDDFPNIYYTIEYFNADGRGEKQTDGTHLLPRAEQPADDKSPAKSTGAEDSSSNRRAQELQAALLAIPGDRLSLKFSHRNAEIAALELSGQATVGQVRELAALWTGIPAREVKLICRGMVLKDDKLSLQKAKVPASARLMIMGGGSS
jgi:hypothetical protein